MIESTTFVNDIPLSVAQAAHKGTSFVPERRAVSEREDYARTLAADYEALQKIADTDEKRETLEAEFARYREGYKARTVAYLASRSRCLSFMITGPARFPTARNEKANNAAHKRLEDLIDYRTRALAAIRKALCPELRPIMSGDADAVERLTAEIAKAEKLQEHMKAVNKIILTKGLDFEAKVAKMVALGMNDTLSRQALTPDAFGELGFPSYRLRNNNANIRRMKQRLTGLERAKAATPKSVEGTAARFEDSPAENRVRLFFPGKPNAEIRSTLKSCGFRWAPSLGCWQAYRNERSIATAKRVAEID